MELEGMVNVYDRKKLEAFTEQHAVIDWHIDDVKQTALNMSEPLTLDDDQCIQVLEALEDNHDASMGINWDTISYQIENCGFENGISQ